MNHRRGVALIMAIVILAALLLLGLPFLFSQSAGLTGTRAFAHQQSAHIGRDTAENAAIAATIEVVAAHLAPTTGAPGAMPAWTSLAEDLKSRYPLAVVDDPEHDRIGLDLSQITPPFTSTTPGDTVLGVHIEDESGKLDPNCLSTAAWDALLKKVGIDDWDDDQTVNSKCVQVFPPSPATPYWDKANDADNYGELAKALAELRLRTSPPLPGRRITRLEQLLLADTGNWVDATGSWSYPSPTPPVKRFGLRKPLTRAELEILRPYLTLHEPAQARSGVIDLGSLVIADRNGVGPWEYFIDGPVDPLLGIGTWLSSEELDVRPEDPPLTRRQGIIASNGTGLRLDLAQGLTKFCEQNDAIVLQASPTLNLNAASRPTRAAAGDVTEARSTWPTPIRTYQDLDAIDAQLPDGTTAVKAYAFIDPLAQRFYPVSVGNTERAERPALGIAGLGVITIEAAASARDPRGMQTAQQYRRVVAQALPQEEPIEARWYTQGALHALVASRAGSALASWPRASERVADLAADDPDLAAAGTPAPLTGLAPATQASYATGWLDRANPNLAVRKPRDTKVDWRLPLGSGVPATVSTVFDAFWMGPSGNGTDGPVLNDLATLPPLADLRPDGVRIDVAGATKRLAYPMRVVDSDGPLRVHGGGSDHANEIRSRHVGFWVRFEVAPAGQVCLAEARMPAANAGVLVDGSNGSNDAENLWRLQYDGATKSFELVLANACIEHPTAYPSDAGPLLAPMDDPLTFDIDERTLGGDALNSAAWITAPSVGTPLPLAPKDPVERVVFRYYQGPIDAKRWYHIEATVVSDTPGGHALIVDGVVGRDVGTASVAAAGDGWTKVGDHATLPSLRLVSAAGFHAGPPPSSPAVLPTADVTTLGGNVLVVDQIRVRPPTGILLSDLLPDRGVIRIDDEYITYEAMDVSSDTLLRCRRGQRANTYMGNANPQLEWPVIQEHLVDALVVPGGYQYTSSGTTFYHGLAVTTTDVTCGHEELNYKDHNGASQVYAPIDSIIADCSEGNNRFRTWAYIDVGGMPDGTDLKTKTSFNLKTVQDMGTPPPFPARGFVRVRTSTGKNAIAYYQNGGAGMTVLNAVDFSGYTPPATFPTSTDLIINPATAGHYAWVVLVSVDVAVGAFGNVADPNLFPKTGAFQIAALDGRIEWIRYDDTALWGGEGHFINFNGFPFLNAAPDQSARGSQRTAFGADVYVNPGPPATFRAAPLPNRVFAPGSTVLPVHADGNSDNFIPGDVVTVIPKNLTANRPAQMVIRYAANDGYPTAVGQAGTRWDTKNEWYAFTDRVPDNVPNVGPAPLPEPTMLVVVGRGWTGYDLSTVGNDPGRRRGILPRMDAWYAGYDTGAANPDPPRWMVGGPDSGRGGVDTRAATVSLVMDAIAAGDTDGTPDGNAADGCRAVCFYDVGGSTPKFQLLKAVAPATNLPIDVLCSDDVFVRPNGGKLGLVLLDGEVFAYRIDAPFGTSKRATLIARALLGSDQNDHRMIQPISVPNRPQAVLGGLPIISLPIGPVLEINTALSDQTWFTFENSTAAGPTATGVEFDAPYALLTSLDGVDREVVAVHGPWRYTVPPLSFIKYVTAPWTRGLYNSEIKSWSGTPAQPVLAIGWWPRFASALPRSADILASGTKQQYFRSRTYAWAGFALRVHGALFDATRFPTAISPAPPIWQMMLTELPTNLTVEARALPAGFDWTSSTVASFTIPGAKVDPAVNNLAFRLGGTPDFSQTVDGAELRLTWHYNTPRSSDFADLARASGTGPLISEVALRTLATARVLAVEDAR